jgi:hypothetical protein
VYTIERKDKRVIVKKGDHLRLNAPEDSYVVYKEAGSGDQKVSKLSDLQDHQLLLALANAIDIPSQ